jgi:ankyrin repeat protein
MRMLKTIPCFLLIGGSVLCILLGTSCTARAQSIPPRSYLFVEVRDSSGKPITDAAIKVSDAEGDPIKDVWSTQILDLKTNEAGVVQTQFRQARSHHYDFLVSKPGYSAVEQVLFPQSPYLDSSVLVEKIPSSERVPTRPLDIRLPALPTTEAQRRAFEKAARRNQLLLAVKRGDAGEVRKLLQAGFDPNVSDDDGVPAITWAAFAGDADSIKELLRAGAKARGKNSFGREALLIYLAEGLTRAPYKGPPGKDISTEEKTQILESHNEIVRGLLKAGAAVNAQDYMGSALNHALARLNGYLTVEHALNYETIKILIAAGANVTAPSRGGETPLMRAAQSYEATKMLLDAGAKPSINARDKDGENALIFATRSSGWTLDSVALLISAGANVNDANNQGQTPLMFAAMTNPLPTVKYLLGSGAKASINARDKWGQTALINALVAPHGGARWIDLETIKALIAAGADVNIKDNRGRSPLAIVQASRDQEAIKLLSGLTKP